MTSNTKVNVADLNALEYLSLIQDTTPISCLRGADISSLTKAVLFDTLAGPRAIICFLDYMDELTYMMGVPETLEMIGFVRVKSTLSEEDIGKNPYFSKGYLPKGVT